MAYVNVPGKAVITVKDAGKNHASMKVEKKDGVATEAELDAFITAIESKTACSIVRKGRLNGAFDSALSGAGNKDDKAILTFQDEIGHVHKYNFPGYSGATEQDNEGLKVTDAEMAIFKAAFEAFTGYVLTPLRSPVIRTP